MRGSPSAVAKAIESFRSAVFDSASVIEGDEVNLDVKVEGYYKPSGFCGTNNRNSRSTADANYCTCLNRKCCGGSNKCNKNRSTCTSCGFNCPTADENMPWNSGVMIDTDADATANNDDNTDDDNTDDDGYDDDDSSGVDCNDSKYDDICNETCS